MVVKVKVSTSNSAPVPPVKTRCSAPEALPVSVVLTLVNVSQPPVTGTATDPSRVPVAEPERIWIVPPTPLEETRALNLVAPLVLMPL